VEGKRWAFRGVKKNIPAMQEERVAAYYANRMKVTYTAESKSIFVEEEQQWNS
jgi:hypothetical protein